MIAREFPLGYAIECIVDIFYNLYNREDDELYFNQQLGNRYPIGLVGATNGTEFPSNYRDTMLPTKYLLLFQMQTVMVISRSVSRKSNLSSCGEIIIAVISVLRNSNEGSVIDDGAMNKVARD